MKRFDQHNEHVRSIVPKDNLLEFRPQDGWEPLCKFLGHDVPEGDYPRTWDGEELVKTAKTMWWMGVAYMMVKVGGPITVALGAWYWFHKS
jgi:hypothetical protein